LFGERDNRISNLDISVNDFPAWIHVAFQFSCAERPFIKLDGLGRASDEHAWRYGVEAVWYWFHIAFHIFTPFMRDRGRSLREDQWTALSGLPRRRPHDRPAFFR